MCADGYGIETGGISCGGERDRVYVWLLGEFYEPNVSSGCRLVGWSIGPVLDVARLPSTYHLFRGRAGAPDPGIPRTVLVDELIPVQGLVPGPLVTVEGRQSSSNPNDYVVTIQVAGGPTITRVFGATLPPIGPLLIPPPLSGAESVHVFVAGLYDPARRRCVTRAHDGAPCDLYAPFNLQDPQSLWSTDGREELAIGVNGAYVRYPWLGQLFAPATD